jgi:hypothetical protein
MTLTDSGRSAAAGFRNSATTEFDRLLAPVAPADRRAFHVALVRPSRNPSQPSATR